jgi:hypothetical protein
MGRKRTATVTPAAPATNSPIGGGWARTDTSFLTGKTIKNVKTDFGANNLSGNGSDETTKLQAIFDTASADNWAFYFPTGVYGHSTSLRMLYGAGKVIYGDGPGLTEIRALSASGSTVNFESHATLRICDLSFTSPGTARYNLDQEHRGVMIYNVAGFTIHNVWVKGCEDAGFFIQGNSLGGYSHDGTVTYCTVDSNYSDGFHVTDASYNVTVQYCKGYRTGDDSFSSIGYGTAILSNINFLDNISIDAGASGFSFEGTNGGTAYRNYVLRSGAAGCRLDTPGSPYFTGNVDSIDCQYNLLEACRTNTGIGNPVVLIWAGNSYVHGVTFSNNTIKNGLTTDAFQIYGASGTVNVTATVSNNTVTNASPGTMTNMWNVGANATLTRAGNTYNGAASNS